MDRPDWPVLPDDIGEVRLVSAVDAEWTPEGWQGRTWIVPEPGWGESALEDDRPAGIPFGISEFPEPPVDLSAYMGYVVAFFQNRLAQGKAISS